ncbi:MAG: uridine kinase [Mycoplasma sp.]|nr:uridine kinase [Candidatus Hennigella equi]
MKNKLIIVAGCSGSGKSTVSSKIKQSFGEKKAQIICMDRFYKVNASKMPKVKKTGHANYDHPNSFDWVLLRKCLRSLLNDKPTKVPVYDYTIHSRKKELELIKPTRIIIFEGFLALYDKVFNDMAELKVYVDTSLEKCFRRRLQRDKKQRKRTEKSIRIQWNESVVPMFNKYVKPNIKVADFLLPWERKNTKSLNYLIAAIKAKM